MQISLDQILAAIPSFDQETRIEIAKAALNASDAASIDPALIAHAEEIAEKIRVGSMKTMPWEDHIKAFEERKKAFLDAGEAG